jgi:hypothetical protein
MTHFNKFTPHILFLLLLMSLCMSCVSGGQGTSKVTTIKLSHQSIDLGKVKINTEVYFDLKVSNSGENPLTIYRVNTSCGCTEVEWEKKPLRPHKTSHIKVKYKDKYPGYIHKTLTIYANIKAPILVQLKGELIE